MNARINELPQVVLNGDFRNDKLDMWIDTWPAGLPDEPWVEEWMKSRNNWRLGFGEIVPLEEGKIILRLDKFLQRDERGVEGDVMLKRAMTMGNCAGQLHAQALLYDKHVIPKEWREFSLIFPGTVWCHHLEEDDGYYQDSYLDDPPEPIFHVLCLEWGHSSGRWNARFRKCNGPYSNGFGSSDRLVRIVK